MELLGIDAGRFAEYSEDVLSEVFGFGDMGYFAEIKSTDWELIWISRGGMNCLTGFMRREC